MSLKLMYITNDVEVACIAQSAGVDRIWVDLEVLGKEERQKNMNTVKSHHTISDIQSLAPVLTSSRLFVRINPWNDHSEAEIEEVIAAGAQIVMLPMWKTSQEVSSFLKVINGRVKTSLLLETKEAVECLDEVLTLEGIDEIHIGLNDLHLAYQMQFMFEPLANGLVEMITTKIKQEGIPFGFGGIAKLGGGTLPAEKIIAEHYRLGSSQVILSRSFCNVDEVIDFKQLKADFITNVKKIRKFEQSLDNYTDQDFQQNKEQVADIVEKILAK